MQCWSLPLRVVLYVRVFPCLNFCAGKDYDAQSLSLVQTKAEIICQISHLLHHIFCNSAVVLANEISLLNKISMNKQMSIKKLNFNLEQAMKAQRGSGAIALLFL
jgi:hypothetical protein